MQKTWENVAAIAGGTISSCIFVSLLARFFDVVTLDYAIAITAFLSATITASILSREGLQKEDF